MTYWVAWASLWPLNIGITHAGPRLTWRHAWCDPPLALGGTSQACMCPCPSPWRVICRDMRGHTISPVRVVPRDWWTLCWIACHESIGQTRPLAMCQLPWHPAGLRFTPWPFTMAGRLTVHGTLRTQRMLRSRQTTCLPREWELGPWLNGGGCWKVG